MLRVCNSAHEPLHTPRTPQSPNAEGLRKQIVGMLQEEQGKENDKHAVRGQAPLIYQIKRKGSVGTILRPEDQTERQFEKIKRSHLRLIRESNSTKSKAFPSIENYVLQGESKETGRVSEPDDPSKIPWGLPGDRKQDMKPKNVRFNIQGEIKKNKEEKKIETDDNNNDSNFLCEIRGSAIHSSDTKSRSLKPSLRQRKTEAAKRQATIHTSLQLFKRRLKLNHESYITPSMNTNHDNDYIIRRVPFNGQNANMQVPRVSSSARPVLEPRLTVDTIQRPKSSIAPCLNVHKSPLKARPQSSPERHPRENHLLRPRLISNVHNQENISVHEEQETVPTVVNTYFVEQSKPKPKQIFQTTLSTHNIDVHNSLTTSPDARMKRINCDHKFDNRFIRWLEESSANSEDARRARMHHHEPPKSPLSPLPSPDPDSAEL